MFQTACRTMHIDLKGLCPQADFAHKLMDDLQSFGYNYILISENTFLFRSSAAASHPYPTIIRDYTKDAGTEAFNQYFEIEKDFFGKPTRFLKAVDNVSFKLKKGSTIGVVGEYCKRY